jgi:hypothetical protein
MTDWFRSWHGAPTDNKWLVIGRRAGVAPGMASAVGWALMDYASQQSDRGSVQGFDVETYAMFSGWEECQIEAVIAAMQDKGMITDGRLSAWEKRQPEREDVTALARKRAQRERDASNKDDMSRNVTHGHATSRDVTIEESRVDKIRVDTEVDLEGEVVLKPAPTGADAPLPTATATNGRSHSTLKAVPKPSPEERREAIRVQILSPPVLEFAAEHTPFIDVPAEAEKFLDYLTANGKAQKDYPAAFRNWLRKAKEFAPAQRTKTNGTTGYQTASERRSESHAAIYDLLHPEENDWREPDADIPAGRPRLAESPQRGGPQVVDAVARSVGNRAG